MKISKIILMIFLILPLITGCGKKAKEIKQAAGKMKDLANKMEEISKDMDGKEPQNPEEAMEQIGKFLSGGQEIETVDYKELKAMLPGKLENLTLINSSAEKNAVWGIEVSEASSSYQSDSGTSINLSITDLGGMSALTTIAGFAWTVSDYEKEDVNGYEKTTIYKGYKAIEEFKKDTGYAKLDILVADRFVVAANGYHTGIEEIKKALNEIDLKKLEGMKNYGIKS
ncbi:MAG: hypothetical protein JW996_01175 [Candidatus Cloacimonetes bacterium]|nr:hypothetical protein [Candidatus Cloacimonadota bacterium]